MRRRKSRVLTFSLTLSLVLGISPTVFGEIFYPNEPEIICKTATPGLSLLCVKGLRIQLGATDEFKGYHPVQGMEVFLLPYDGPDIGSITPDQIKDKAVSSGSTNEEGDLSLVVSPAKYFFCAMGQLPWSSRVNWSCQEIELKADVPRKIMVSQYPRGGELLIEIKAAFYGTK